MTSNIILEGSDLYKYPTCKCPLNRRSCSILKLEKGSLRNLSAVLRQIRLKDLRFGALSICSDGV